MTNIKIDQIIRSRRKTLSLEITHDARLIVRAPKAASFSYIEKFIIEKRLWIQDKQKMVKERHSQSQPKKFVNGEEFLYLGDTLRLYIVESDLPFLFYQGFYLSRAYLAEARQMFINWYKQEAYKRIKERVDLYSNLTGLKYNKFSITNAQKRWGSCSAKNNLCFSWRLVMFPLHVIDYVVIHELAHIEEKNHSQRFWNKVKIIIPNFKESRKWLKENGHLSIV